MLFSWVLKQGFSYLSEVGARGLLNFGKKTYIPSNWEDNITKPPFKID